MTALVFFLLAYLDKSAGDDHEQNEQYKNRASGSPRIVAARCGHEVNLLQKLVI
ncbi:hypothetical protein D3C76_503040 [compost metagenome]